ncbi:AcrR family transcriptional regulator [Caulobacter ginsengisoli]|uniref:AcrR family transcriptional regulator n=1 Tax=Caulobacter ginsengisoli TaxID=400775 RepID=A0ABU0IUF9_9CAUL|nr:TetR/AcrR family transcriptional regulator [Caulobacter ginsengisoli]MDQ0464773.1 AcrR family transcriptional regulator [Caulobacter ginsengisoli]
MATQAQRREATRGAILAAAGALFADAGFAATSVDDIARAAGVAKGAVYHHFPSKEAVFEAVFEAASRSLIGPVIKAAMTASDELDSIVVGTEAYFRACADPAFARIILRDGPAVLGWQRWREIDAQHFGGMIPASLKSAMRDGLMAEQPVEPLGRLLAGAVTEAAVACAAAEDPIATGLAHVEALRGLLQGLRKA